MIFECGGGANALGVAIATPNADAPIKKVRLFVIPYSPPKSHRRHFW